MKKKTILLINVFFMTLMSTAQNVTTLAGSTQGFADGLGTTAKFDHPYGLATDSAGNVYVADTYNHKIRKITSTGLVTTLAGSSQGFANGTGTSAQFNFPHGVATDASGNLYVADYGNNKIRKITSTGVVSTLAGSDLQGFADGTGATAMFNLPVGIATDSSGNIYVAEQGNHKIRKITPAGEVSTLAGSTQGFADGIGTTAQFNNPMSLTIDTSGNVYIGDISNYKIRKIDPTGLVSTLAGSTLGYADGIGDSAKFYYPYGVAVDATGDVYVTDNNNHKIRKITPTGVVTTFAGSTQGFSDGIGAAAQFTNPLGIATDVFGNVYITNFADFGNHNIRKITQLQLGIFQNDILSKVTISPNPVKTLLTIQIENFCIIDKILITELNGKIIFTQTQNSNTINVENLTKGLYFLEIYSGNQKMISKFIKE